MPDEIVPDQCPYERLSTDAQIEALHANSLGHVVADVDVQLLVLVCVFHLAILCIKIVTKKYYARLTGFFTSHVQTVQNQNALIFEGMAKSWLKKAGIIALAFVAYRGYQLYELGNSFSYRFKGMFFRRPKGLDLVNNLIIVLEYVIVNPTKSSLKMNGMYGTVSVKGQQIAAYQSGPFTIKPGETPIKVEMVVNPYFAATTLLPDVKKGNFPIFDTTLTAVFPFRITHTEKFAINTKDYIPSSVLPLFI